MEVAEKKFVILDKKDGDQILNKPGERTCLDVFFFFILKNSEGTNIHFFLERPVRRLCREWQTTVEGRIRILAKKETTRPKTTVEA